MFRPNIIGLDMNRNVSNEKNYKTASILAGTQRPAPTLGGGGADGCHSLIGSAIA